MAINQCRHTTGGGGAIFEMAMSGQSGCCRRQRTRAMRAGVTGISAEIVLADEQRQQLESWSCSTLVPHGLVLPSEINLTSAAGLTKTAVAHRIGIS